LTSEKAAQPSTNIASYLPQVTALDPARVAVTAPAGKCTDGRLTYSTWTFGQLDSASDRYAHGFVSMGIGKSTRTLLMVRPGFDLMALSFALFKVGAVPVLIDPGMGKSNLLDCVKNAQPEAMVAVPLAHMARRVYPRCFRSVRRLVTAGTRWLWGGETTEGLLRKAPPDPFTIVPTKPDDMAAILFTTGSTGPPKGVVYEHGMFDAQVRLIRERYRVTTGDVDMPAFPLFGLFSIAMGMSVVIPDMDPTKPAQADPARLVEQINGRGVTFTFGSPAIWRNVSRYCVDNDVKLPSLTRVLMAGAPVAPIIHDRLINHILPGGAQTYTPFGATESLPVCDITGSEVLAETAQLSMEGRGACVGRPLPGMSVRIIKISDDPIDQWDESMALAQGEVGEIVAQGPVVTKEYFRMPEQTRLAKIIDGQAVTDGETVMDGETVTDGRTVMHRMGDVGYLDSQGRLWFCGRKSHRVVTSDGTLFTIPVESIFNRHPNVFRSALVGVGAAPEQRPVIIVELDRSRTVRDRKALTRDLLALGASNPLSAPVHDILYHPELPTDIRHNAKIFREKLKPWAEKTLGWI